MVNSPLVTFKQIFSKSVSLFSFISKGNTYPHAIALLYSSDGLPDIRLTEKKPVIKITPEILKLLSGAIVDIVIYGCRAIAEHCSVFEELYSALIGQKYLLREYDILSEIEHDYSLNRCTQETEPFLAKKFKLGRTTPGRENDCNNAVKFILEEHVMDVATSPVLTKHPSDEEILETASHCTSRLSPSDYWSISSRKMHKYVQVRSLVVIVLALLNQVSNILPYCKMYYTHLTSYINVSVYRQKWIYNKWMSFVNQLHFGKI